MIKMKSIIAKFQLTRLMRGVTLSLVLLIINSLISTHTPHARRDKAFIIRLRNVVISTHTPHARRDTEHGDYTKWLADFNSHASCEA